MDPQRRPRLLFSQYAAPYTQPCAPPGVSLGSCGHGWTIVSLNPDGSGKQVFMDNDTSDAAHWALNCSDQGGAVNRCRTLLRHFRNW
jgi:hypothetical protein